MHCRQWAYLAGLWHDLGKYRPGFQRYIRQVADAHIEGKLPANSDKSHSAAGAVHAMRIMERQFGPPGATLARALAYVIAGHHAGLADWTASLDQRLLGAAPNSSQREHDEAIATCQEHHPDLLAWPTDFGLQQMLAAMPAVTTRSHSRSGSACCSLRSWTPTSSTPRRSWTGSVQPSAPASSRFRTTCIS
jgi:CRISPR-associated endonuclease/helicase Cas3